MPKIMKIGLSLSKICRKYRRLFFDHGVQYTKKQNQHANSHTSNAGFDCITLRLQHLQQISQHRNCTSASG